MKQNKQPKVLILGGYGTFGSRIARELCHQSYHVIINGRHSKSANALRKQLIKEHTNAQIDVACFDIYHDLAPQLKQLKPTLVIHTCGPFQGQDTRTAKTIISAGIHYIDLADGRDYVKQMMDLDPLAKRHGVTAITAASTVPALSSAALMSLQKQHQIESFQQVKIGISPGQKTARGYATAQAVLSYIGQALAPWRGNRKTHYGWQDIYLQKYPTISNRLMSNCEAADLDFLPDYFPIQQLHFAAGMESKLLHGLIWLCSWLVRIGLPLRLTQHTSKLLKASRWFDFLGTTDGGMHVDIEAVNTHGETLHKTWYIIAKNNCGPHIPAVPAIIMTKKILGAVVNKPGVRPCINEISLSEYLAELDQTNIKTYLCG